MALLFDFEKSKYNQIVIRKGDVAEMAFMTRAMRFGFNACKPLNSDCPYDVAVEAGE